MVLGHRALGILRLRISGFRILEVTALKILRIFSPLVYT